MTPSEPLVQVDADPDRLRQAIGNLVGNAVRYCSPGGRITLTLSVGPQQLTLDVTDTGCGIAPEDLPNVFDRFWRADAARARTTGGSGLGLSIAHQIILDHQGTITVSSELGTGTTFTITLPRLDPEVEPEVGSEVGPDQGVDLGGSPGVDPGQGVDPRLDHGLELAAVDAPGSGPTDLQVPSADGRRRT